MVSVDLADICHSKVQAEPAELIKFLSVELNRTGSQVARAACMQINCDPFSQIVGLINVKGGRLNWNKARCGLVCHVLLSVLEISEPFVKQASQWSESSRQQRTVSEAYR